MSKKRKLDETSLRETVRLPRKARLVGDEHGSDAESLSEISRGLENEDAQVTPGKDVGKEKKNQERNLDTPDKSERPDVLVSTEEKHLVVERDGEKRIANPQVDQKGNAAQRQAKSERRSKKRKHREAAPTEQAASPPTEANAIPEQILAPLTEQEQDLRVHSEPDDDPITQPPIASIVDTKQRFIVFIGNLPYTATTASIQHHFSKLQPFTVRHSTDKSTGRSRGFAFLEFEGYDKMKTCLKLYHHSLFDARDTAESAGEGKRREMKPRKINVELTAGGGGGKSEARKERIRGKNEKLEGERERARVHREKEEAALKRKKGKTGANAVEVADADGGPGDEHIHPSRRKRIKT
jgi:nucleolar protein 6